MKKIAKLLALTAFIATPVVAEPAIEMPVEVTAEKDCTDCDCHKRTEETCDLDGECCKSEEEVAPAVENTEEAAS